LASAECVKNHERCPDATWTSFMVFYALSTCQQTDLSAFDLAFSD